MSVMALSRHEGRVNQKERTRAALVDAATELFRNGHSPTVAEAAEKAKVSRATAYRYFPTQDSLLVEIAAISPAVTPIDDTLARLTGDDPEQRLLQLLEAFNPVVIEEEVPFRAALRVYLDTWLAARNAGLEAPAVREGRRIRWLDEALAPMKSTMSTAQYRRARSALALTLGIEQRVVMKDVCHLDDDEAEETLRWAATALLRASLADAASAKERKQRRRG